VTPAAQEVIAQALPRLSVAAKLALLHCLVLADDDGRVTGLWHSPSQLAGATREELKAALAELHAEDLICGEWPHRFSLSERLRGQG